jgi:diguanylate cyclase
MDLVNQLATQQDQFKKLLAGIDRGIQDHLAWNQRLLRCALLRDPPGEDILNLDAYQHCQFGKWLLAERATLTGFDPTTTRDVEHQHRAMHDAVRMLCEQASCGMPVRLEDLQAYETAQTTMVDRLNVLRQRVAESVLQMDALTGLPLRNGLDYAFQIRQKDAARQSVPLHLAMVDVDHFKVVNDTWGHPVGDTALKHLSKLMTGCLRDNDIGVRYGGEEFLFLLLGHEAEAVVQRILNEVRSHPMVMGGGAKLPMTVTAGVTPVSPMDTLASAVSRADAALLHGKQSGRDRYVLVPIPPS